MTRLAHYADLRNGGNMPRKARWPDWHTLGLCVSVLLLAVMAVILEGVM